MDEPTAGQWWCMKDDPSVMVWLVGLSTCGNWVIEWSDGTTSMCCLDDFYHEPRCNGWAWNPDQPQPAEDPDEWVVLDPVQYAGHVLRKNIDFTNTRTGWEPISIWGGDTIGGILKHYSDTLFRCRRRDLPKVEQAEQWPKYYKPSQPRKTGYGKHVAYYKCSETEKGETVHTDGTSFGFTVRAPGFDWTEITEAEAMLLLSRRTEPEPQPQKTRVRLFASFGALHMRMPGEITEGIGKEIHHDSEGFYVEKHP